MRFVYGTKINCPDYIIKGDTIYKVVTDHLGSVRLVVNSVTGNVVQQIEYDEYGNLLFNSNPGWQPFYFAGGLYDQQTKLIRFGARDYDSETGRWVAKDPILFAGGVSNLYEYCVNDPVNLQDFSGLQSTGFGGFIGNVAGINQGKSQNENPCEIKQEIEENVDIFSFEAFENFIDLEAQASLYALGTVFNLSSFGPAFEGAQWFHSLYLGIGSVGVTAAQDTYTGLVTGEFNYENTGLGFLTLGLSSTRKKAIDVAASVVGFILGLPH